MNQARGHSETQVEIVPGHVFKIDSACVVGVGIHDDDAQTEGVINFYYLGGPDYLGSPHSTIERPRNFKPEYERFHGLYVACQIRPETRAFHHRVLCQRADGDKKIQILLAFCEGHLLHAHQPWDEDGKRRNEALNPIGMAREVLVLNVPDTLKSGSYKFQDADDPKRASHLYRAGEPRFHRVIGGANLGQTLVLQPHGHKAITLETKWEIDESLLKM